MTRTYVPTTLDHCKDLAPRLRPYDALELAATVDQRHTDITEALIDCLVIGWGGTTILEGSKPIGVFGNCPGGVGADGLYYGTPWLLGSDELSQNPRWLVREGRRWVREWLTKDDVLENHCLAGNAQSIRWLRAIGAKFTNAALSRGRHWYRFVFTKESIQCALPKQSPGACRPPQP